MSILVNVFPVYRIKKKCEITFVISGFINNADPLKTSPMEKIKIP